MGISKDENNTGTSGGTFIDALTVYEDDGDPTKKMKFEVSGVTAGQTRILAVPNASGTLYITGGTDVSIADGGTGASSAPSARTNLGFADGTYTPVRSDEVNLDANVGVLDAQYSRVGSVVTVSGSFSANPTLAANTTSFEFTLPIASNLTATQQLGGVAFCGSIAGMGAVIYGDAATDKAKFEWISSDVANRTWSYIYQYVII